MVSRWLESSNDSFLVIMKSKLDSLLSQVEWIKSNLSTRQSWTKSDYEDFYLRDIKVLFELAALLKEKDEGQKDRI